MHLEDQNDLLADYGFEIATTMIAVLALISAERAIKIAKHALLFTKDASLLSLRLNAREAIGDAERSYLALKLECQRIRDQWEHHQKRTLPPLGRHMFETPKEIQDINTVERTGNTLLRELLAEAPNQEAIDQVKLEKFIGLAKAKSLQIEGLRLQLCSPAP